IVRGTEILEQDSPRDSVDDEMVNDEKQVRAVVAPPSEEHRAHDRPTLDVEASLCARTVGFQDFLLCALIEMRQTHDFEGHVDIDICVRCAPAPASSSREPNS